MHVTIAMHIVNIVHMISMHITITMHIIIIVHIISMRVTFNCAYYDYCAYNLDACYYCYAYY